MVRLTEDEVRNSAGGILGFTVIGNHGEMINVENDKVISGVGQLTTFNQLGKKLKTDVFNGVKDKPDGWYFTLDNSVPAIILEAKSSDEDVRLQKWADELAKNTKIASKKYSKVIGILWNGVEQRVFLDGNEIEGVSKTL